MSDLAPYLSIVVPLFNEEDNVCKLVERIEGVVRDLPYWSEVILVDDGSVDLTADRARGLVNRYDNLKLIIFRRNFGQTAAMVAGLQYAKGTVLVTLDGDLQNSPEDIPRFVAKIEEGFSLVIGWRANRRDALFSRVLPSRIANWIIGKITGVPIKDNGCSLKAYRAELIKQVPLYSEMHRFIPAMTSMGSTNFCELEVQHHARSAGQSKYGMNRIYKVIIDLIGIKALLVTARSSTVFFAVPASIAAGIATPLLYQGVLLNSLTLFGSGLLWASAATMLGFLGVLTAMLVSTGSLPVSTLSLLGAEKRGRLQP